MKAQEACKNSRLPADTWFPNGNMKPDDDAQLAIAICNQCPVKRQCAETVLRSIGTQYPIKSGIWAGVRIAESHADRGGLKAKYEQLRRIAELEMAA